MRLSLSQGHDSTTLEIPDAQMTLVEATTAAAKSPVTVVIFCANPLDISKLLSNDKIGAIIHVGQPSITIYGIAEVLFGMKSPAGRTIQTIYPASYADEISIFVRSSVVLGVLCNILLIWPRNSRLHDRSYACAVARIST